MTFDEFLLKDTGRDMEWHRRAKTYGLEFARACWEAAIEFEREECAKVCDTISGGHWLDFKTAPTSDPKRGNVYVEGQSDGADDCADAIRARGDQ